MNNIAVIISGSGHLDGAEITESVLSLLALDTLGVEYTIFSIDMPQHHVVNHLTGEVDENDTRNVLVESARIARGDITDLKNLQIEAFDGLLLTGGFGVGKNFTSFAFDGSGSDINDDLQTIVEKFYQHQKPIGAICIAPVVLALTLGKYAPMLTIGNDLDTIAELKKLGSMHQQCSATDCVIDTENKLVTTPAYMIDGVKRNEVYQGISTLIKALITLV